MKDMGEASSVLGVEIFRDQSRGLLGLSQKAYVNSIPERFNMQNCSRWKAPISRGDQFSKDQCPRNDIERKQIQDIPYASMIGSLLYAQTCTHPDISFAVSMLGRYQSNPGMVHWKAAKKVMRYLQWTKEHMLTYKKSDHLEVIGYSGLNFVRCLDTRRPSLSQNLTYDDGRIIFFFFLFFFLIHASLLRNELLRISINIKNRP